jgi:hypothetical protein
MQHLFAEAMVATGNIKEEHPISQRFSVRSTLLFALLFTLLLTHTSLLNASTL